MKKVFLISVVAFCFYFIGYPCTSADDKVKEWIKEEQNLKLNPPPAILDLDTLFDLRIKELVPPDVVEYLFNFRGCNFLGGEINGDGSEHDQKVIESQKKVCPLADQQEKELRIKYKNDVPLQKQIEIIKSEIEAYTNNFVWNDPGKKSKVLNEYYEAFTKAILTKGNKLISRYSAAQSNQNSQAEILSIKKQVNELTENFDGISANIDRLTSPTKKEFLEMRKKTETILLPA